MKFTVMKTHKVSYTCVESSTVCLYLSAELFGGMKVTYVEVTNY